MINPESHFPTTKDGTGTVDPLIFFQDLSNQNTRSSDTSKSMARSGRYEEAINQYHNSDIDIFDANVINCFQNRLYNLQQYLFSLGQEKRHVYYSDGEGVVNGNELLATETGDLIVTHEQETFSVGSMHMPEDAIWVSSYTWN